LVKDLPRFGTVGEGTVSGWAFELYRALVAGN
jgi:hypothetical protein